MQLAMVVLIPGWVCLGQGSALSWKKLHTLMILEMVRINDFSSSTEAVITCPYHITKQQLTTVSTSTDKSTMP